MLEKFRQLLTNSKARNLFFYGIGQVFNLIAPLIAVPYIIGICGEAAYGKVGVALAIAFVLIVFIDYGADIIGVKEISVNRDKPDELRRIFTVTYGARLILLSLVLFLTAAVFMLVPYFHDERPLFFLTLPILVGQYFNPIWFLQGVEQFRMITVLNIVSKAIYLAGVFLFVKLPGDYIYVNLWWGIGMILPFAFAFLLCVSRYGVSFSRLRLAQIKHFLKADWKFCFSQLFVALKNYSPIMVIGLLGGFTTAGYFKVIEQIIMPFRSYVQMFYRFFYPSLCYEVYLDVRKGFDFWKRINFWNTLLLVVILAAIFFFTPEILAFFKLSPDAIKSVSGVLRFSLLLPLLIAASYALEQLNLSLGKKQLYINITIATALVNLVLMLLLFSYFDLVGLISALIVTEIVVMAVNWDIVSKQFKAHRS